MLLKCDYLNNIRGFMNIFSKIDLQDVICLLGLCFLGTGLWWLEPWISFVVVGSILILLSVVPDIMIAKQHKKGR